MKDSPERRTQERNGRFQAIRLALGWGALWGVAVGFSLLAAPLLRSHHLCPDDPSQWIVLGLFLFVTFGGLGALLSLFACSVLVAWEALRRRSFRDPTWAYALAVAPLLGLSYFADAAAIEWLNFGRVAGLGRHRFLFGVAATVELAAAASAIWIYAQLAARPRRVRPSGLATVLLGAAALAASYLPQQISCRATSEETVARSLVRLAGDRRAASPLLFVGLDSGNWPTLRPLLERNSVATFQHLIISGTHGEVRAFPPPFWSAPAWAAIITGATREANGIHEDLVAIAPGLPSFEVPLTLDLVLDPVLAFEYALLRADLVRLVPHPRSSLKRPPFWELLSQAGVETAVVRFPFTFPADGRADFVISNWVGSDEWKLLGVRTEAESGLAAPPALDSELRAPFSGDSPEDEKIVADLLAGNMPEKPTDSVIDPVEVLRLAASIDRRTFEASMRLIRSHPDLGLLAVYLGGFDSVCHAFWQYRFPEEFPASPPSAANVQAFGPVIDRYLEFLDHELGRLIQAYESSPNVIVIADHGHEAIHSHMLWKGWHAERGGIFLAAGPGIPHQAQELEVSYLDVVPTLLELEGFAQPESLPGHSLLGTLRPK